MSELEETCRIEIEEIRSHFWRQAQAEHDCYELPKCAPLCDYYGDEPPWWFDPKEMHG